MLADVALTADPVHVWNYMVITGFLLSSGASVVAILGQRRMQKREVSFAQEFVSPEACDLKHVEIERRVSNIEDQLVDLRREMKADRIALDAADEQRASRLHARIDGLERDIDSKLQSIPDRIAAIFRNMGVIK